MSGASVVTPLRRAVGTALYGTDGRPRAVYRIVVPFGFTILALILGDTVASQTVGGSGELGAFVQSGASAVVFVAALAVTARYFDRRPIREYGLSLTGQWGTDAGAGFLIAIALAGVQLVVSFAVGSVQVTSLTSPDESMALAVPLVIAFLTQVAVVVIEEGLFRGVILTNAAERLAARSLSPRAALVGAWAFSSVLFALIHLPLGKIPDGAPRWALVAFWLGMGVLLGLCYVLTGELGLSMGLHAGTNWAANYVFIAVEPPGIVLINNTATGMWHVFALPLVIGTLAATGLAIGYCYWRNGSLSFDESISLPPSQFRS